MNYSLNADTETVAERIRAELTDIVESASNSACGATGAPTDADHASVDAIALAAAEEVYDEAVSIGHWTLRGLGMSDYCHTSDSDPVEQAVGHGLLIISGAAYLAAKRAYEALLAPKGATYVCDGIPVPLVTSHPDEGDGIPVVTIDELTEWNARIAETTPDSEMVPLVFDDRLIYATPCDADGCEPDDGDFHALLDGRHAHLDDAAEYEIANGVVHLSGIPFVRVTPKCEYSETDEHVWVRDGDGLLAFDATCSACGVPGRATVTLRK